MLTSGSSGGGGCVFRCLSDMSLSTHLGEPPFSYSSFSCHSISSGSRKPTPLHSHQIQRPSVCRLEVLYEFHRYRGLAFVMFSCCVYPMFTGRNSTVESESHKIRTPAPFLVENLVLVR